MAPSPGRDATLAATALCLIATNVAAQSLDHDRCYSPRVAAADRVRSCRRVVYDEPREVRPKLALGWPLHDAGDFQAALSQFKAVERFDRKNARASFAIGATLLRLGELNGARDALSAATRLDSTLADAWRALSLVSADLGEIDVALASVNRALSLAPGEPLLHFERGILLSRVDSAAAAFRSFAAAARLRDTEAEFWGALAVVLVRLHKDREAVAFWERAKLLRPSYFDDRPDERSLYERRIASVGAQPAATLEALPP